MPTTTKGVGMRKGTRIALGIVGGVVAVIVAAAGTLAILNRPLTRAEVDEAIRQRLQAAVTAVLVASASADVLDRSGVASLVVLVVAIVCVANLGDFLLYRRAQRRLYRLQATLGATQDGRGDSRPAPQKHWW
ncbi:hypothetical protein [Actinoplanes sp. NPDC023714]|uniref:hypothetical protein n=1 Tax=Actinoplanes sp. NPDC023714 TaxID=3154322 RepID=UPI0033CE38FA